MNWEKAKAGKRDRAPRKRKRRTIKVHPNSMAARKWGKTTWDSTYE
jgi:hypothetical protein